MNIRKFIAGVLACCIAGGAMPAFENVTDNTAITASAVDEEEYTEGTYEQLTYKKYSDHIEISDCDHSATEVVIPSEINDIPVKNIGYEAFSNCYNLTNITIPDSVTSIGNRVFFGCSRLTDITIPESVTSIGNSAFYWCTRLTDITIPESVTSIGEDAFYDTPWLESKRKENPLVIVNVILIDGTACSGDVIIPDGITSIQSSAFSGCSNLKSITIPESVTSIGSLAFANCTSLTSINIPNSVTSIGWNTFSYTAWLEEKQAENPLVIVNGILIDGSACSDDVIIPDSVKSIGISAFSECSNLKSITIPDSVTSIRDGAFEYCSSLTDITIPNSVTSIGDWAFFACSSLEKIVIENPECELNYDSISDTATIYGYDKSTAQAYAEKYGNKFVSLGEAPETAGGDALIGDANCDGTVDLADVAAIIQHIGNEAKYALSEQGLANADCNSDGKITGADALAIQKLEAKLIGSLPDLN